VSYPGGEVLAQLEFSSPQIEYARLYPLLIVVGVAVVGVLVEAFAPRRWRYPVQLVLSLAGLVAALVGTALVGRGLRERGGAIGSIVAEGAVAVDGPTVFLWGTLLALGIASVLLFAERRLEGGVTAFAGQAAALPGTAAEREASVGGVEHTEVFPLAMF